MPEQTSFFDEIIDGTRVEVLKSYDEVFAREAFEQMDDEAIAFLARSLNVGDSNDVTGPNPGDPDYSDVIWDELKDGAREDWNTFSYFIVAEVSAGRTSSLFVSADWPTAEAFAKRRISLLQ
jgi:hypothetical protein